MGSSCPFCGMPALDGEPCCTWEYRRDRIKRADRDNAALRAENERLRRSAPSGVDVAIVREYVDANAALAYCDADDDGGAQAWVSASARFTLAEDALRTALSAAAKAGGSPRAPGGEGGDRG